MSLLLVRLASPFRIEDGTEKELRHRTLATSDV